MKFYDYRPEENGSKDFKGVIVLKWLNYNERLQLIKKLNFKVGKQGNFQENDSMEIALKLINLSAEYVEKVDVYHVESEEKFSSLEDLGYYSEGVELISELSNILVNGVSLGKKSGKK